MSHPLRFESVRVLREGRPRPLVDGTRIVLTVQEGGAVSVWAGCNAMNAPGGVRDARLDPQVVMTLKSCGPARDAQDLWLGAFLSSGPRWEHEGNELRLISNDTTIEFVATAGDA